MPFYLLLLILIKKEYVGNREELPVILALSENRFRDDLRILSGVSGFTIYTIKADWLIRIARLFYDDNYNINRTDFFGENIPQKILAAREIYRSLLRSTLPKVFKVFNIKCVIGAAIGYKQDYDFGAVSNSLGCPYIVLQRENLITNKAHYEFFREKAETLIPFEGSYIVTHNDVCKKAFIDCGYASEENISSLGCLRMDEYVSKLEQKNITSEAKCVTLFSFPPGVGVLDKYYLENLGNKNWPEKDRLGLFNYYRNVHVTFTELARDNPEINFYIKTKNSGDWIDNVKNIIQSAGIELNNISNLIITNDINVQELIKKSSVICGYGSTTLLEASIIAKPVVVPFFDELTQEKYKDYAHFPDEMDIFDIAKTTEDFKRLIIERINSNIISDNVMERRKEVFEKYVSSLSGDATRKYTDLIIEINKAVYSNN